MLTDSQISDMRQAAGLQPLQTNGQTQDQSSAAFMSGLNIPQQTQQNQQQGTPSTMANSGMGTADAGKWAQPAAELITGGEAGQDIGQAIYSIFGGQKQMSDIQNQALQNGSTLLSLAQKQSDPDTKLKYSQMAADEFTRAGNVPEDIIGKVRSGGQVTGDFLGLGANLAIGGGALSGAGAVDTGIANPILKGAAEGAISGAAQGGTFGATQGLAQGMQNKQNLGGLAQSTAEGGAIGAGVGLVGGAALGAGGATKDILMAPGAQTAEQQALQNATKDVTPDYNAKKMPAGEMNFNEKGEPIAPRVNESTGLGQRTVNSNIMEGKAGKAVADLGTDYPNKGTFLQKAQAVNSAIADEASQLRSELSNYETVQMPREITKNLVESAVNRAADESLVLQPTDPIVNKYMNLVNKAVDGNPETLEGTLNVRQAMDDAYKSVRGKLAFGSDQANALDSIHTAARNELNQQMIENAPNAAVKESLQKQFDLYRAYDVLNQKAQTEGNSAVSRILKKVPGGKKTVLGVAGALGVGSVAGAASKVLK